jgi:hypothetical protein
MSTIESIANPLQQLSFTEAKQVRDFLMEGHEPDAVELWHRDGIVCEFVGQFKDLPPDWFDIEKVTLLPEEEKQRQQLFNALRSIPPASDEDIAEQDEVLKLLRP